MTGNSDGLSPSLKPFLGVGHNRALPAPFGFGNCYNPTVTGGHFKIPNLLMKYLPDDLTVEFFYRNTANQNNYLSIGGSANLGLNAGSLSNNTLSVGMRNGSTGYGYAGVIPLKNDGSLNHIMCALSRSLDRDIKYGCWFNGGTGNSVDGTDIGRQGVTSTIGADGKFGDRIILTQAMVGMGSYQYGSELIYMTGKIAEFRIYNTCLTKFHAANHYNVGIGQNPSVTEHLILWLKFESFEMLDFSALQDGSDMKLGIRDHSGNNNHAQPIVMETNPASPNYVLKPF